MHKLIASLLLLSFVHAPAPAQTPWPVEDEEVWTELPVDDEEEEVLPPPSREPARETIAEMMMEWQQPEILIGAEPTQAAWRGVRNRMQTNFNSLREGMKLPTDAWDFNGALETWLGDLDVYAEFAVALASDNFTEINRQVQVLELLSEYLAIDYEAGNPVHIEATMRQMDQMLQRLELSAVQADARAGRVDQWGFALFPPDWGEPRYRDNLFADALTFQSSAELSVMLRERHQHLFRIHPNLLATDTETVAREVVELARALARRQAELPDLSRPGYRNVTMRMEVVAENIVEFSRTRDRHGYNRQVFLLGETIRDLEGFLSLSEAARQ